MIFIGQEAVSDVERPRTILNPLVLGENNMTKTAAPELKPDEDTLNLLMEYTRNSRADVLRFLGAAEQCGYVLTRAAATQSGEMPKPVQYSDGSLSREYEEHPAVCPAQVEEVSRLKTDIATYVQMNADLYSRIERAENALRFYTDDKKFRAHWDRQFGKWVTEILEDGGKTAKYYFESEDNEEKPHTI